MSDINSVLKEIKTIEYTLANAKLSVADRQTLLDNLKEKKHEAEKLSKTTPMIIPGDGPTIKNRKVQSISNFQDNRYFL